MSNPMTMISATTKFQCDTCNDGGDCGFECVLSSTCSIKCIHCGKRIFFHSEYKNQEPELHCPYCGEYQVSRTIQRAIEINRKTK